MSLRVLNWGSKKSRFRRQLQCQEECIDHIPHYPSGLSGAFFPTTFLEIAVYFPTKPHFAAARAGVTQCSPPPHGCFKPTYIFYEFVCSDQEGAVLGGGGGVVLSEEL